MARSQAANLSETALRWRAPPIIRSSHHKIHHPDLLEVDASRNRDSFRHPNIMAVLGLAVLAFATADEEAATATVSIAVHVGLVSRRRTRTAMRRGIT